MVKYSCAPELFDKSMQNHELWLLNSWTPFKFWGERISKKKYFLTFFFLPTEVVGGAEYDGEDGNSQQKVGHLLHLPVGEQAVAPVGLLKQKEIV